MGSGEGGDRRHARQRLSQGKHGFDAFAGGDHFGRRGPVEADPDAMAEKHAHGPARVGNERLDGAIGIEPGAVEALDGEGLVGDGSDHGWKDRCACRRRCGGSRTGGNAGFLACRRGR